MIVSISELLKEATINNSRYMTSQKDGDLLCSMSRPPKMRQGGGRYNRGGYIELREYRQRISVWEIVANK